MNISYIRAIALRSGAPGFKTCSDHSLNLILVVPSLPYWKIPNWFASGQLGFLTVVVECSVVSLIVFHLPRKVPMGSDKLYMYARMYIFYIICINYSLPRRHFLM